MVGILGELKCGRSHIKGTYVNDEASKIWVK